MIETLTTHAPVSTARLWIGRVVGAWVVLFLAFDAVVKLLKLSVALQATTRVGYPENVVVSLGAVELICLLALLFPRTSIAGAVLLTGYLGGATATQVRVGDPWFVFPVVIGALAWMSMWLRDPQVGWRLFGGRVAT